MLESRFPPIILMTLLIACLCIYGIILHPNLTFAGMDFINLGFPRVSLARNAFAAGHLPLWNWYEWGGVPLLAPLLGALLYPPTWIAMLLPLPFGLQLFTFCHLFLAGLGAYCVGRQMLSLNSPAAAVCGIVYMGNSFFPGRIEQFQVIAVNSLLPWLILATAAAVHRHRSNLWLAIVWCGTLLAGHPQFAVFNIISAGLLVGIPYCFKSFKSSGSAEIKSIGTTVLLAAAAIGLGTAAAAMQLLPTWELGTLSERIWPYREPTHPQLEWQHLPALAVPNYYNLLTGQQGRVFGFTELGLYAGIMTVPLALLGIYAGLRHQRVKTATIIAIWLLALLFALGTNGAIAPVFFENVPFFTQSRGAARSLNIAALMLALLAGRGAMAVLQAKLLAVSSRHIVAVIAILLLLTADLAVSHYGNLSSSMVSTRALSARPLLPKPQQKALQQHPRRLYRFMAFDSDLYLNNTATAVAERNIRLQPNLNSLASIAVVDGYEEGLMPLRARANMLRRYNRNLRSESPDPALIAFLGSDILLTEYPLPVSKHWSLLTRGASRPPVVPAITGNSATYQFLQSQYNPALLLDLDRLIPHQDQISRFLIEVETAFPLNEQSRVPANAAWVSHPLQEITPFAYAAARAGFTVSSNYTTWNALTATNASNTTRALVLIPPYPGWKAKSEKSGISSLKPLNSLFYLLQLPEKDGVYPPANLIFSPFSVRLGLFISLISTAIISQLLFNRLRHHILTKKIIRVSTNDAT